MQILPLLRHNGVAVQMDPRSIWFLTLNLLIDSRKTDGCFFHAWVFIGAVETQMEIQKDAKSEFWIICMATEPKSISFGVKIE